MKNYTKLIMLLICVLALSCKNEGPEKAEEIKVEKQAIVAPKTESVQRIECYSYLKNKDTIYLALRIKDDSIVQGDLAYSYYQKDATKGQINGRISNDSLYANFNYTSEGTSAEREVFFLRTTTGFVEGNTNLVEINGKNVFENNDFKLNNKFLLERTDCR